MKKNPSTSTYLFLAAVGVGGFLMLKKLAAKKVAPKFFMAARWDGDKFIGNQCWSIEQNTWVDASFCGRK
jgi:hypothetical protein